MSRRLMALFALMTACAIAVGVAPTGPGVNLLPPEVSALDGPEALPYVIYLRPSKAVAERPDEFYRIVSDRPFRGKGCLAVTTAGVEHHAVILTAPEGPFKAGEALCASAWLRADPPMDVAVFLYTTDVGRQGLTAKEQIREIWKLGPDWRQCWVSAKLGRDARYAWLLIRSLHEDATQRTFHVDEARLERGTQPGPPSVPDAASSPAQAAAEEPSFAAPFCDTPPRVDGRLDDPCWAKALRLDRFVINDGKQRPSSQRVEVFLAHDNKRLYVAGRCEEKDLARLTNRSPGRDQPDWEDDRLEMFVDALGIGKSPTYYLSVNAYGVTADSYLGVGEWDPDLSLAVGREDAAWTLEAVIPFEAFGRRDATGEQWRMNFGRHHRGSVRESSTLVPLEGKFCQPGRFARITLAPAGPEPALTAVCLSRGEMTRAGFRTGGNTAVYEARNQGAPTRLTFRVENRSQGQALARQEMEAAVPTGVRRFEQPYRIIGDKDEQVVFEALDAQGRPLYRGEHRLSSVRPVFRVYDLRDPLDAPPLDRRTGKGGRMDGHLVWHMPFAAYPNAIQSASAYNYEKTRRQVSDAGMHLLAPYSPPLPCIRPESYVLRDRTSFPAHIRENRERGWGGPVLYAPYYILGRDEQGRPGAFTDVSGWLADPVNRHAFLASVAAALDEHGRDMWAVCAGDEQWSRQLHLADQFFSRTYDPENPQHAWFRQAEEEIRRECGFGRFGLPHRVKADHPDYPFCRRAYLTWLTDRLRLANRELRRVVKGRFPDMPIVSEDSHGGSIIDVEHWSEYADIGSLQAQYQPEPATQSYAYHAKLGRDLSGLDRLLVCPHDCVAGFPTGALESEELRELYSQLFRGGATGLHAWPASYGEKKPSPPLASSVELGYPLAWRWLLAVSRHALDTPPPRLPEADAAVFVSSESEKCGVELRDRGLWLFTFLGVQARGWFRFISEGLLDLGRVRLEDFRVVYVPSMRYARRDTGDALLAYCRQGGVVVCLDPAALERDITSASLADAREQLFGVRLRAERRPASTLAFSEPLVPQVASLKAVGSDHGATDVEAVSSSARVLARFEDGRPAIVENRLGKGRAYYLAWCPLTREACLDADWRRFFTEWHAALGGKTGLDVWRFRLPLLASADESDPEGVCLTGNYGLWDRYEFIEGKRFNRDTGGEYVLEAGGRRVVRPFRDGRLTDRLQLRTRDVYGGAVHPLDWARRFSAANWAEALDDPGPALVTFDFRQEYPMGRVRMFYSGVLPGAAVSVSRDGATWTDTAAVAPSRTGEKEVAMQDVPLAPARTGRYLRLALPAREAKDGLLLIEVEVWAKE